MANYVFGVDIGGTTVKIGLFTTQGEMVEKWEITTRTDEGGKYILSDIAASVEDKLAEKRIEKSDVAGVGMGVPGPVKADGTVIKCVNLGWGIFNVEEELSKLLALPVKAGNDANMAALGEMWQGGGKGHKDIVMVTLGTGVGGGIILDGKMLAGTNGAGGEIGHICVNDDETEVCGCGNKGCLEQYTSATGIVRMAKIILNTTDKPSKLRQIQYISAKEIFDAAKEGDELAATLVENHGKVLGKALATVPIGGFLFMKGSLSLSTLVMCLILSMGLVTPLITVMSYSDDIGKMGSILGEVTGVLSWEEQLRPINDNKQIKDYSICLENVRFSYREKEVLHGVNLKIESGTVNALVGPSGSGKSTIAKLIASLWDVDSGSIKIGGVDISELSLKNYNRKIAYVSQDNYLFDNTIRENIRMGDLNATDKQVEQAAKDCGCHEFIMALPDGYDTIVGSAGGHLSGGERQRISIARAMLKNAPIIILDEATAYTDPENEALIQHSVAKLIKGKTLIVIAHRLSTIVDADQIFVIENGTVAETGTHNELLANGEIYSNMWRAHMSVKDSEQEVEPRA